jgi:hypothetical protein
MLERYPFKLGWLRRLPNPVLNGYPFGPLNTLFRLFNIINKIEVFGIFVAATGFASDKPAFNFLQCSIQQNQGCIQITVHISLRSYKPFNNGNNSDGFAAGFTKG